MKLIFFHITQVSSYTNHPELKAQATQMDTVSGLSRKGTEECTFWGPATRESRDRPELMSGPSAVSWREIGCMDEGVFIESEVFQLGKGASKDFQA